MSRKVFLCEWTVINLLSSCHTSKLLFQLILHQTVVYQNKKTIISGWIIPSDVPYAKELKSEDVNNDMALFSSSTHIFKMKIGTEPTITYPIVSLIDTGATPNRISIVFIKSQWNSRIKRQETIRLWTADKQLLPITGKIFIHFRIGELCAGTWFGIVEKLTVELPLGTSSIDCYIPVIFPSEHKLVRGTHHLSQ